MTSGGKVWWLAWSAAFATGSAYLGSRLLSGDETVFLPGRTTHGHYQIELACDSCHTDRFASADDLQAACVECHGAELELANDSHPKSKFTDPRNADRVALLDARYCVTCHKEHVPEQTLVMGLTLPVDYCYRCHHDIGEERESHAGLPFDGCAAGGCHNFHDNRALYEDFLLEHADEAWLAPDPRVPARTTGERFAAYRRAPLAPGDQDAPADLPDLAAWVEEWSASSHAAAGVNCSGCHGDATAWSDTPPPELCGECHEDERKAFLQSRHGMRTAAGLSPMRPDLARLPMAADAKGDLHCGRCHAAHAFDTADAGVVPCEGCHADEHTLAYRDSPHYALYARERAGEAPVGSGVSCATCHLPRMEVGGEVRVHHDQNDTLRPNEKMIRPVCLRCHGLAFSIDALADADLVRANFAGRPARHVESIDMALTRVEFERRTE